MSRVIHVQLKLQLRPAQERQLRRWLWHMTAVWNGAALKLERDAAASIRYGAYEFKGLLNGHSRRLGVAYTR
jgi:hypothetical protein